MFGKKFLFTRWRFTEKLIVNTFDGVAAVSDRETNKTQFPNSIEMNQQIRGNDHETRTTSTILSSQNKPPSNEQINVILKFTKSAVVAVLYDIFLHVQREENL